MVFSYRWFITSDSKLTVSTFRSNPPKLIEYLFWTVELSNLVRMIPRKTTPTKYTSQIAPATVGACNSTIPFSTSRSSVVLSQFTFYNDPFCFSSQN